MHQIWENPTYSINNGILANDTLKSVKKLNV